MSVKGTDVKLIKMKRIIFTFIGIAFLASASAQIDVDVLGNIKIGGSTTNFLGTNSNAPIIFKVNNSTTAGYTGYSGNTNVSFGYGALSNPLVGFCNLAIGYNALNSNTGFQNTANGYHALYRNTSGYCNTANSAYALESNTTGSHNTANGYVALWLNTSGNYNTANGAYTLESNTTGNNNTAVGYNADVNAGNLSNATAIGNKAKATASNQVRIGNSSVTSIGGYAAWTNLSDGRAKKNIQTDVPGLDFINRLQPVTYNLDLDVIDELLKSDDPQINSLRDSLRLARSPEAKEIEDKAREAKQKQIQTGFVAQDVEKIAKSIGYDFSGVDVDELGVYGLRYAEFVVPLVKAVQELSEQAEKQQEQIKQLVKLLNIKSIDEKAFQENGIESISLLLQNAPNPFNQTTEIGYYIPENVNSANIYIYDINGFQQKNIFISERGKGATTVQASSLQAGIYFYTLICDGKPVDTKQMILTK